MGKGVREKGALEGFGLTMGTNSHRRILHRRRPGSQRRNESSAKLSNRVRMLTSSNRGCGHRHPENDGREHTARCKSPSNNPHMHFL